MSERSILEKLIADGEYAKAKLKELDTPKRKHGDVVYYYGSQSDPIVYLDGRWFNYCEEKPHNGSVVKHCIKLRTEFNIFTLIEER